MAAWLLNEFWNPDAPLASITLLLSPSPGELLHPVVLARMAGQTAPATRKAVQREFIAFRDRCRSDVDNLAFVYVVGHGVQLDKRGAIVLLEDFAIDDEDDVLFGAIDVVACHDAMDDDDMAARQIWFSDACRTASRRGSPLQQSRRCVSAVQRTPGPDGGKPIVSVGLDQRRGVR